MESNQTVPEKLVLGGYEHRLSLHAYKFMDRTMCALTVIEDDPITTDLEGNWSENEYCEAIFDIKYDMIDPIIEKLKEIKQFFENNKPQL
jgi:hypothetical protein